MLTKNEATVRATACSRMESKVDPRNNWRHIIPALKIDHSIGNGDLSSCFSLTDSAGTEKESLEHKWILDIGATRHVTDNLASLSTINSVYSTVKMGNGNTVELYKMETLKATNVVDTAVKIVSIVKVESSLQFITNLLSVSCIRKKKMDLNLRTVNDNPELGRVEVI